MPALHMRKRLEWGVVAKREAVNATPDLLGTRAFLLAELPSSEEFQYRAGRAAPEPRLSLSIGVDARCGGCELQCSGRQGVTPGHTR